MHDVIIRKIGTAGRITLNRPDALNALTHEMCRAIETALLGWQNDSEIRSVVFDARGERAFCAGGDITTLYEAGRAGDFLYGRKFWTDEYRLNALIFDYPRPVVAFMQGFTMGGGVGLGCHGSHRIVGGTSRIAMPECGIGLVPDVGGSLILALAPGETGAYLGTTGYRMKAADAIFAGFADYHIHEDRWPALMAELEAGQSVEVLHAAAQAHTDAPLAGLQPAINRHFSGESFADILSSLQKDESDFASDTLTRLKSNAPLSMAATVEIIRRLRRSPMTISSALDLEYRFTTRAMTHGDLLEGIRAAIIDKDRKPVWQYADGPVPASAVDKMLRPLDGAP